MPLKSDLTAVVSDDCFCPVTTFSDGPLCTLDVKSNT